MRPLPKKRSARRRSTKATVVEALARRDAHRRSVRGVTAASLRSNAAAASPLNRLGQIRGDAGHFGTARRPRGHRAGARQARVLTAVSRRSEASSRIAERVCAAFSGQKGFNPFFLRQEIARKTGFFNSGTYLAGPICTSNLSAHGASGAEIERQNLFC